MHVLLETPNYDRTSGQKLSTPMVQKFYAKEFQQMEKDNNFAGFKVTILHEADRVPEENLQLNLTPVSSPVLLVDTTLPKPLEEMNIIELVKQYRRFYNEDPLDEYTKEDIITRINDRIEWIETEKEKEINKPGALFTAPKSLTEKAASGMTVGEAKDTQAAVGHPGPDAGIASAQTRRSSTRNPPSTDPKKD